MSNKMGMGDWSRLRLRCAALLMMLTQAMAAYAARLDPGTMKFYPLVLPPTLSTMWVTNQAVTSSGNSVTPSPAVLLTNLSDNNPATLVTLSNSIGLFIDMGQTNVVDRVFLIGGNHTNLNIWPNWQQNQTNPPLGLIVVSVGNSGPTMKQAATWTVPCDAGNPVDTEVDLRFSPVAGRYVRIELQTNVTWGANYWPGASQSYILASGQPPLPTNLTWNVGELELYGFSGSLTNLNAVVCDSYTNPMGTVSSLQQPLQIAALDLSYYLGELTGSPHPIITSAQTNLYPGTIYRIEDLAPLAPDYNTMMANIASGALPTNPVVLAVGREVQFTGWPYRCVDWGVWEFLERQGVRWVYPDGHGDYVPTGNGVSLSMLPLQVIASAISIGATIDVDQLKPWPEYTLQSVRQEYLYAWRNRCNFANNLGPIGGNEIPKMSSLGSSYVNSNYTEAFVGYPHNFNSVVPNRILEMPSAPYTNWWGWATTNAGSQVNPTNNPYENAPAWTMDDPTLISWVAKKMTNIAAATPLAATCPLAAAPFLRSYNLLPIDSSTFSQDPYTIASNGAVQLNPVPWVTSYAGGQAFSGAYFSFVNAVANQAQQMGYTGLVGALAYADVFPPPANIATFPTNVQVQVCLYGAPNLPMSDPANAAMKAAFDGWHAKCARLTTYDYALLHTDYWEQDPRLPVPLVVGTVDRAKYLSSIGALDGTVQGSLTSLPYNPWNFYAYPRIRWNTNQTASTLETEFFNGYFKEAAAPMLAYYQGFENYQVTNGINLHYQGYAYGITPGSFPLSVLASMQASLAAAAQLATNWYVIDRVADMQAGFNWVITNSGLGGVSLTDATPYPTIGSTTNPYTVNLTNMVRFAPSYAIMHTGGNLYFNGSVPYWYFWSGGQIKETFNIAMAGTYTVTISAKAIQSAGIWPIMNVFFGPKSAGSATVNTVNDSAYSFSVTIPTGSWDLVLNYFNDATGGARNLIIDNIQITRQ
jgi:hypothetical protein